MGPLPCPGACAPHLGRAGAERHPCVQRDYEGAARHSRWRTPRQRCRPGHGARSRRPHRRVLGVERLLRALLARGAGQRQEQHHDEAAQHEARAPGPAGRGHVRAQQRGALPAARRPQPLERQQRPVHPDLAHDHRGVRRDGAGRPRRQRAPAGDGRQRRLVVRLRRPGPGVVPRRRLADHAAGDDVQRAAPVHAPRRRVRLDEPGGQVPDHPGRQRRDENGGHAHRPHELRRLDEPRGGGRERHHLEQRPERLQPARLEPVHEDRRGQPRGAAGDRARLRGAELGIRPGPGGRAGGEGRVARAAAAGDGDLDGQPRGAGDAHP
mmetsp:Transcript_36189/g.95801  ORF Transcript_36189/g.95801 Transcript_36189/m.95801 type:complete len:324 (-) Transcript_36189:173-1144(-)